MLDMGDVREIDIFLHQQIPKIPIVYAHMNCAIYTRHSINSSLLHKLIKSDFTYIDQFLLVKDNEF